jgi:homoserine kinase
MSGRRESVTVCVPGSTSNCGAGFDTLGLALQLYNRVTLTRAAGATAQPERPADARASDLVAAAAAQFYHATGARAEGFRFRIEGDVPTARGLGSSATILVGVLAGLDALLETKLSPHRLAELGTALEGNPENICAGIFGGFTISRTDPTTGTYRGTIRVAVPTELKFVVASPALEMATKESRGVLPKTLPFADAARSVNSAAFLTAAFTTGNFAALRHAAGDYLHEPYRLPRIPGAGAAIDAGIAAGALTGWLSGSGSSVLCLARAETATTISAAMSEAFRAAASDCVVRVLEADNAGFTVV